MNAECTSNVTTAFWRDGRLVLAAGCEVILLEATTGVKLLEFEGATGPAASAIISRESYAASTVLGRACEIDHLAPFFAFASFRKRKDANCIVPCIVPRLPRQDGEGCP